MTEREQFEMGYAAKWKAATGKTQSVAELAAVVATMRDGDQYNDGTSNQPPYINNLWEGWQMRAALAQPVAAEPVEMALCESHRLVLRIGQPYTFVPVDGCASCEQMAKEAHDAYGTAPNSSIEE